MRTNILCHYAEVGGKSRIRRKEPIVFLSTDPRFGNVYFEPDRVSLGLGRQLDSVSLDLCEIAAYVYLGDKAVSRGRYENWTREFSFHIPVRNLDRWNSVKTLLTNTVATLSGDNIQFHFLPKAIGKRSEQNAEISWPKYFPSSDCSCLFSGGLDSFAGAVYLIKQGRRPLFASHYVSVIRGLQGHLIEAVEREFGQALHHFQYRVTSRRSKYTRFLFRSRESSHRARSFLFLSFAAVAAALHGFSDVYICENGVLSLNVPISDARKGSRSTRHAHPLYLLYFNQLINALYERTFEVQNPFEFWTKREEVELLKKTNLSPLIRNTVTCWGYPNQTLRYPHSNHCGYCLPCIVRRVSLIEAGLEAFDDQYVVDVFGSSVGLSETRRRNMEDLIFFCRSFATLSKTELLYRYPELVMIEAGARPSKDDKVERIIRVYKKFATEFLSVATSRNPGLLATTLQGTSVSA